MWYLSEWGLLLYFIVSIVYVICGVKSMRKLNRNSEIDEKTVGRFYFESSVMLAFRRVEEVFAGEAEKAGVMSGEEMQDYMKEIRKEVRGGY